MHAGHGQGARRSSPPLSTEPTPRVYHFSSTVAGQTYIYGGFIRAEDDEKSVFGFLQKKEVWKRHTTTGTPPQGSLRVGACTSVGDVIYMYGDYNSRSEVQFGLYSLDVREMKWSKVSNGPRLRGCGIAHRKNKLVVFGGYGVNRMSNELHIFDLEEGSWSSPEVTGTRPPPCRNFTFTMVDDRRVLLFGGHLGIGKSGDAYILDMEKMHWSKLEYPEGEPCPAGRWDHAAVCLGQGTRPQLVVIGGQDDNFQVLNDVLWILDVESGRWKEIKHPNLSWRYGHSATAISLSEGLTEVTLFGGRDDEGVLSDTTVLRFEQNRTTGEWELVDVGKSSHIGTAERLKKKEERIAHHGKQYFLQAYRHILSTQECIEMWFLKVVLLGAPRLGKTTVRRRLTGEIDDISSSGEGVQPSTGAVESGHSVLIRNISSTTAMVAPTKWSASKDLMSEAHLFLQYIFNHISEKRLLQNKTDKGSDEANMPSVRGKSPPAVSGSNVATEPEVALSADSGAKSSSSLSSSVASKPSDPIQAESSSSQNEGMSEMAELLREVGPEMLRSVGQSCADTAFLKFEDRGGQPEFMDLQAALTLGSALYLVFCKLTDDLDSRFTVTYSSHSGESTIPIESSCTAKEMVFNSLASISCFQSSNIARLQACGSGFEELVSSCHKSIVYMVGTHKDLLANEQLTVEQKIAEFDEKLQQSLRSTDFFREGLVRFVSAKRMVLAIDNMNGGEGEIREVRKFLEDGVKKHFKKLTIPVSWLMLSLCLRKREQRTASLESVLHLAGDLGISEEEAMIALWFLHHYAGVLMYFPKLPELKDTVICDNQIVYDSATELIVYTFRFGSVRVAVSERFQKTGLFMLEDIAKATAGVSGDYLPLDKLVKLLQHINAIATFTPSQHSLLGNSMATTKELLFMPCVLQSASPEELIEWRRSISKLLTGAPIFITYECGYVPFGVFPATIGKLAGDKAVKKMVDGIKKNRVQFQFGSDRDTVTLVSQPKYYAIHVTRRQTAKRFKKSLHEVCSAILELVESTLVAVTSGMNYNLAFKHQLAFECPVHAEGQQLCVVDTEELPPCLMCCPLCPEPLELDNKHMVWFEECSLIDKDDSQTTPETPKAWALSRSCPTMKHLYLIQWEFEDAEQDYRLVNRVSSKWKQFGRRINLEEDLMTTWDRQVRGSSEECWDMVMQRWLKGERHNYPLTWEGLFKLLKDVAFQGVVPDLKHAVESAASQGKLC